MIKSCYIHIPFCEKICSYCDFCKLFYNEKLVDKYLDSLEKEISDIYQGEPLKTIYIGGGTPSCLSLKQLDRLFKILDILKKEESYEFTVEGNFENTTEEKLKRYKKQGVNRLSFGLESINKNNLELLERDVSLSKVKEIITLSKKMGFLNINIDLMYALPKESIEILKKDLDFVFSLNIEHISTYSLIIENHTKLKINGIENVDEDLDNEMYEVICKEMKEHGYNHYEISNFAKDSYESKHNLTYWNNEEYYGFGLGASSYRNNQRIQNTKSLQRYCNGFYQKGIETLSKKDKIEYEVILNLRKREGISLKKFKEEFQKELIEYYDYKDLIKKELLVLENNNLRIPEEKFYISNTIITELLLKEI